MDRVRVACGTWVQRSRTRRQIGGRARWSAPAVKECEVATTTERRGPAVRLLILTLNLISESPRTYLRNISIVLDRLPSGEHTHENTRALRDAASDSTQQQLRAANSPVQRAATRLVVVEQIATKQQEIHFVKMSSPEHLLEGFKGIVTAYRVALCEPEVVVSCDHDPEHVRVAAQIGSGSDVIESSSVQAALTYSTVSSAIRSRIEQTSRGHFLWRVRRHCVISCQPRAIPDVATRARDREALRPTE